MGKILDKILEPLVTKQIDKLIISGDIAKKAQELGVQSPIYPTPRSLFSDPFSLLSQTNYKEKLSPITYDVLYTMAMKTEVVAAIINTRLSQLGSFTQPARYKNKTGLGYQVRFKDAKKKPTKAELEYLYSIEEFMHRCGSTNIYRSGERRDNFDTFIRKLMKDSLTYDQAAFEVVPDRVGRPAELWAIDGATVRIAQPNLQNFNVEDGRDVVKYVQIFQNQIRHTYTFQEMAFCVRNVDSNIKMNGYGHCYDDQTEILTKDHGFVKFADLLPTDLVATRNPETKHFEWQKPTDYIKQSYEGDMYHFTSRSMDMVVTPNHRILKTTYPGNREYEKNRVIMETREKVVLAKDFADGLRSNQKIPVTSYWKGEEIDKVVLKPNDRKNDTPGSKPKDIVISGDDYCALMGAYLAEGNVKADKKGIEINQKDFSKGFSAFEELFKRINCDNKSGHNGKAFIVGEVALYEHCEKFGHAADKFVPEIIKNSTPRQLGIFWRFYNLGDGTLDKRKNASGRWRTGAYSNRISTVSKRMADDLVEIAQKIGLSASVSTNCAKTIQILNNKRPSECKEKYVIILRHSSAMSVRSEKIKYSGTINCVTVPNGIVYVRRNGKPCWSGNSELETLVNIVTSILWAEEYNKRFFSQGQMINGILNFKDSNIPQEQLEAFRRQWLALSQSVTNAHKMPVFSAKGGIDFVNLHATNRDMEYDNWMQFLVKITSALYLIDPAEINFDFRGASESAPLFESSPEAKLKHSRDKGLRSLLNFIEQKMNFHVVQELNPLLYFEFVGIDMKDEQEIVNIRASEIASYKKVNEVREDAGLEPLSEEDGGNEIANPVLIQYKLQQQQLQLQQQSAAQQPEAPPQQPSPQDMAQKVTHTQGFEPE